MAYKNFPITISERQDIIKAVVSVLFVFVFFVIIATVIQSSNHSSAVEREQTANALSNNATQSLNSKLDNNGMNFEAGVKENKNNLPVTPRAYLNEENKIVFVDSNDNVAGYLDMDRLKISFFNSFDNMSERYSAIYLMGDVIERPDKVFYFFASTGSACGSGGCSYIFYKYRALADKLEALDVRSIIGSPPKIFLSPDGRKAAVLSHMRAGLACPATNLIVFDLTLGVIKKITGFNDDDFPESFVEKIIWRTDTEIGFTVDNFDCDARWKGSWNRDFMYDIKKQKLTLAGEKFIPANESGG